LARGGGKIGAGKTFWGKENWGGRLEVWTGSTIKIGRTGAPTPAKKKMERRPGL